jgi:hypothetical protein
MLYSSHDEELLSIIDIQATTNPSSIYAPPPNKAKQKSRAKRDSINNVETLKTTETSSEETQKASPAISTSNDTTALDSAGYVDFVPSDTIGFGSIDGENFFKKELKAVEIPPKVFIPNPTRALWLAAVFPGAGQIYNRKYWKLPIFYGGFLGCTYALLWNQQMYTDYSQAYLDIMDDNPNTNTHLEMLPPRYDITGREERFKTIFKNKKNFYRRNRDLSAFCFVGVYLLSIVDAYVDAHLSIFDISPDLSLQLQPAVIENKNTLPHNSYGVGCSLFF